MIVDRSPENQSFIELIKRYFRNAVEDHDRRIREEVEIAITPLKRQFEEESARNREMMAECNSKYADLIRKEEESSVAKQRMESQIQELITQQAEHFKQREEWERHRNIWLKKVKEWERQETEWRMKENIWAEEKGNWNRERERFEAQRKDFYQEKSRLMQELENAKRMLAEERSIWVHEKDIWLQKEATWTSLEEDWEMKEEALIQRSDDIGLALKSLISNPIPRAIVDTLPLREREVVSEILEAAHIKAVKECDRWNII